MHGESIRYDHVVKPGPGPISPRVSILLALLLLVLGLLAGKYALHFLTDSEPGYWVGFTICAGVAITFLAASGFFLNSRRDGIQLQRASAGLCVACGYNLTGNTSGVCPEFGQKIYMRTRNPDLADYGRQTPKEPRTK